jgi:hypothetical protein
MGNDIAQLYRAYEALGAANKAEFETTDQFNRRIEAAEAKAFMGSVTETTTLAFVVPMVSEYDADATALYVGVKCADPHGDLKKVSHSIVVGWRQGKRSYIGSNAFGASIRVDRTDVEKFDIDVRNWMDFPIDDKDLIGSSIKSTPDEARRIKHTLSALAVCSIKRGEVLTLHDFILEKATFNDPHEYSEDIYFLNTKLVAIWFFDSSAGKIYTKVGPTEVMK